MNWLRSLIYRGTYRERDHEWERAIKAMARRRIELAW